MGCFFDRWLKRITYVLPTEERGKSQWLSTQYGLPFVLCRGIHDLLASEAVSKRWSSRATEKIAALRLENDFLREAQDAVVVTRQANEIRWFTFAGNMLNLSLADAIRQIGYENISVSDFWIRVNETTDNERVFSNLDRLSPEAVRSAFRIPEDFLNQLKFNECLPPHIAEEILKERSLDLGLLEKVLTANRYVLLD